MAERIVKASEEFTPEEKYKYFKKRVDNLNLPIDKRRYAQVKVEYYEIEEQCRQDLKNPNLTPDERLAAEKLLNDTLAKDNGGAIRERLGLEQHGYLPGQTYSKKKEPQNEKRKSNA